MKGIPANDIIREPCFHPADSTSVGAEVGQSHVDTISQGAERGSNVLLLESTSLRAPFSFAFTILRNNILGYSSCCHDKNPLRKAIYAGIRSHRKHSSWLPAQEHMSITAGNPGWLELETAGQGASGSLPPLYTAQNPRTGIFKMGLSTSITLTKIIPTGSPVS